MAIKFSEFVSSLLSLPTEFIVGYDSASSQNIKISKADLVSSVKSEVGIPLIGNLNGGTITAGSTLYGGLAAATVTGLEINRRTFVSKGTISSVYFRTTGAMTGVFQATVRKNGVDTAMTMTIATGSAAGLYTVSTGAFSVNDGDEISIKFTQTVANCTVVFAFGFILK